MKQRPLFAVSMLILGLVAIQSGQNGLPRWVNISNGYRAHIVVSLLAGVGLITCGVLALTRRKALPALLRLGSTACLAVGISLILGTVTHVLPCTSPS